MPSPRDLEQFEDIPIAFLVVAGRSGSMLLQTLLDQHAQLLQWPHTFKLFDFLATHVDYAERTGIDMAAAFVDFSSHQPLFDSTLSVLHAGRLGSDMKSEVKIDKARFVEAVASMLPQRVGTARRLVCAIHLALAHCLARDTSEVKTILIHVHHGDWLWPDELVETGNVTAADNWRGIDQLRPERIIISARDPVATIESIANFTAKVTTTTETCEFWFERYLRFLIQDWLRIPRYIKDSIPTLVVRLEDLRLDLTAEMARICAHLGLAPALRSSSTPTAYGYEWWGDTYSAPTLTPNPPRDIQSSLWSDPNHVFFQLGAGAISAKYGYPTLNSIMLKCAVWVPLPTLTISNGMRLARYGKRASYTRSVIVARSDFLRATEKSRQSVAGVY